MGSKEIKEDSWFKDFYDYFTAAHVSSYELKCFGVKFICSFFMTKINRDKENDIHVCRSALKCCGYGATLKTMYVSGYKILSWLEELPDEGKVVCFRFTDIATKWVKEKVVTK